MDHQLEFRVLGPLEIMADGEPVKVPPKQRSVLAMLLIHANEVVSTDQLLEAAWGEEQPSSGPRTLHFHISQLREALPDVIATRAPGYVLEVSPSQVDELVFESLLAEALIEIAKKRVVGTFTEEECERYGIDPCPALE